MTRNSRRLRRAAPIARLRRLLPMLCVLLHGLAAAVVSANEDYADEARSWGVSAPPGYRGSNYHAPTPDAIPAARIVKTTELRAMLQRGSRPFLLDVLSGGPHPTLPGSIWLHNAGLGDFSAAEERRFLEVIALIAGDDQDRALVFFCSGARCWLSYNAALRAVRAGYRNVFWYRGGIDAWRAAGLPTVTSDNFQW